MDLKEAEALGASADTHWYYVSKFRAMLAHVPHRVGTVLDVGAGLGWFSRRMVAEGHAARAICVDPGYAEERREAVGIGSVSYVREIVREDVDLVLMMDVLEHVDDDVALLAEYLGRVPPGTPVFITVPAFEFLWSAHDDYLEHRRRYTADRLAQTITAAGARVDALHYYYGAVLPIAMAVRWMRRGRTADRSDMAPQPAPINAALTGLCTAERAVMTLNRLGGLSVVARCSRPA